MAPHQRLQFELNTRSENCDGKYQPDVMCTVAEGVSLCLCGKSAFLLEFY